ncbi:chloroplast organization [Dionaea muscipula]
MSVYTSFVNPQLFPSPCTMKASLLIIPSSFAPSRGLFSTPNSTSNLYPCLATSSSQIHSCPRETRCCTTISRGIDSMPDPEPTSDSKIKPKRRGRPKKVVDPQKGEKIYPTTIPRKPRPGRRSEAVAPEDFVRDSLEKTPAAIREQNSDILENKEKILKERVEDGIDNVGGGGDQNSDDDDDNPRKMVVDEDCPNWPLDADVGWGIRASEYFEKHPIKNVVGEDGVEIDWEGEIDNSWVEEINCLEWETFAFHPSPLIVLVFERYNR